MGEKQADQTVPLLASKIQRLAEDLGKIEQDAMDAMQGIAERYWETIGQLNLARKEEPSKDRREAMTSLTLSRQHKNGRLYVNWVVQKPWRRGQSRPGVMPIKQHIRKGRASHTYSEASLSPHMRGWEREIVMTTERELGQLRELISAASAAREKLKLSYAHQTESREDIT